MAKLINALLVAVALGNGLMVNGMKGDAAKSAITMIVSPSINDQILGRFLQEQKYDIQYIPFDTKLALADKIADAKSKGNKVIFHATGLDALPWLKNYVPKYDIDAVILEDPIYNPQHDYISDLGEKIPKKIPIIIHAQQRPEHDAKLFYAFLRPSHRSSNNQKNVNSQDNSYADNILLIINQSTFDPEAIVNRTCDIRSYKHQIDPDFKKIVDSIRSEEKNRYYKSLFATLLPIGGIAIFFLYYLHKINAFNAILDHIQSLRQ